MKDKIFISYSSSNKALADRICSKFEDAGLICWMAPRDIAPGADWAEAIIDAIDEARTMIVVFTPEANESVQVKREIERAVSKNRPVLPLKLGDFKPTKSMEYFLSSHHWHILDEQDVDSSVEAVVVKLGGRATTPPARPEATGREASPIEKPPKETKKAQAPSVKSQAAIEDRKTPEVKSEAGAREKQKKKPGPMIWGGVALVAILVVLFFVFKPFGTGSGEEIAGDNEEMAVRSPADLMESQGGAEGKAARKLDESQINSVYGDESSAEAGMELPADIGENLALLSKDDIALDKKKEISENTLERFTDRDVPVNLMIGDIVDEQIGIYDYMVRLSTMSDVNLKTIRVDKDENGKIRELFLESDQ